MADNAFQVSGKLSDGRIYVVGANTWPEFVAAITDALGPQGAESSIAGFATALAGGSVAAVAAAPQHAAPQQQAPMTPVEVAAAFGGSVISDQAAVVCKHGEPAKFVPAGVSKKTGKPYRAFYACARRENECDFRANG